MDKELQEILDEHLYMLFSARAVGLKDGGEKAEEIDKYIRDKSQEFMEMFGAMGTDEIMMDMILRRVKRMKEMNGDGEE